MIPLPLEERTGRLVQVRRGCGQFGSDAFFVRRRDGSLQSFENVAIRHYSGDLPTLTEDSTEQEYTLRGAWPETGFIIEEPSQPETPGAFAITITTAHE